MEGGRRGPLGTNDGGRGDSGRHQHDNGAAHAAAERGGINDADDPGGSTAWASHNRVLTDHDEIRKWAEERGARPARVTGTGSRDDPGILRLDFPGYTGEDTLEPISWEEWFKGFDQHRLALIVQDTTADGKRSNFNKLVSRDTVEETADAR